MINFGLITEGKTDQIVIENILVGYFQSDDLDVNELQPLRDETDERRGQYFGGWHKVFEYCQSDKFKESFQFNDYVIVQIDTDESEKTHYDVSKRGKDGKPLSPEQLIEKIVEKFKEKIGEDFYHQKEKNIIFAISVETIECWLLPLYYTDKRKSKTAGCTEAVNRELRKKGLNTLTNKNKEKNPESYRKVSKIYHKHKILMNKYKENPSLTVFIEELRKRKIIVKEDDF